MHASTSREIARQKILVRMERSLEEAARNGEFSTLIDYGHPDLRAEVAIWLCGRGYYIEDSAFHRDAFWVKW